MTLETEQELWDDAARSHREPAVTFEDRYGRTVPDPYAEPVPAAHPQPLADCETCHGTGYDDAFQSPCDCHRYAGTSSLAARLAGAAGAYDRTTDRAHQPGDRMDGRTFGRSSSPPSPSGPTLEPAELAELAAWMEQQTWSTFAVSIADQYRRTGRLSPKQIAAAQSMKTKCENRRRETETSSPTGPMTTTRDTPAGLERTTTVAPPTVAAGRYAVDLDDGHGLRFFRVDTPDDGRWKGYTFVDEQASDDLYPVRQRDRRATILEAIADDPAGARLRYAVELGRCMRCNATLTSQWRTRGIGPECAKKVDA